MTFEQILNDLRNKIYYPVYFLCGEEPYYIDEISDYIEHHLLDDAEKEFNQTVVYGKDVDVATLVGYAKRFPMMSNYQVVIVKEAQDIKDLIPKEKEQLEQKAKNKKGEEKSKSLFETYIEHPLNSTILVLCYKYKKIDKRKSVFKAIEKKGILLNTIKLYDNKIPDWIVNYLKNKSYTITQRGCMLLSESLGNDLHKIVNEITKLIINLPPHAQITEDIIEKNTGISKDFNVFELQKALGEKNIYRSNFILNHLTGNPKENSIFQIIAVLFSFFSKILLYHQLEDKSQNNVASVLGINPFFVNDYKTAASKYSFEKAGRIISLIRAYDMKAKGVDNVSTEEGELLRELIFKILH